MSSAEHTKTEFLLYGSIPSKSIDQLLQRLRGICDPGAPIKFTEHNMCFKLKTNQSQIVQVHARRRLKVDSLYWHFRYIGVPELSNTNVVVRKTIDSLVYSNNMMEFVKSLGLRIDYEYVSEGCLFTCGTYGQRIKILVYRILTTESTGVYSNLKQYGDSYLVEASIILPEGHPHGNASKALKDLSDELFPLCKLEKIKYNE